MSRLRTWLQLFRAPNLFTVPGDPIAGFMLANYGVISLDVLPAIGASLCFYAAGLLDNDLADFAEDRAERPDRPLPSGRAHVGVVSAVAAALFLLGLWLCYLVGKPTLGIGLLTVLAVLAYNHGIKRIPVLGALNMGACRGLSLLLGAAAAPAAMIPREAIAAAILSGSYIAAVTNLARFETKKSAPPNAKYLPATVLFVAIFTTLTWDQIGLRNDRVIAAIAITSLLTIAFALATRIALVLRNPEVPLPPMIGKFIRLLLVLQAAFIVHTGGLGLIVAVLILALWPISRAASRRFYAS